MNEVQKSVTLKLNRLVTVADHRMSCFDSRGDLKDLDEAESAFELIRKLCDSRLTLIAAIRRHK